MLWVFRYAHNISFINTCQIYMATVTFTHYISNVCWIQKGTYDEN